MGKRAPNEQFCARCGRRASRVHQRHSCRAYPLPSAADGVVAGSVASGLPQHDGAHAHPVERIRPLTPTRPRPRCAWYALDEWGGRVARARPCRCRRRCCCCYAAALCGGPATHQLYHRSAARRRRQIRAPSSPATGSPTLWAARACAGPRPARAGTRSRSRRQTPRVSASAPGFAHWPSSRKTSRRARAAGVTARRSGAPHAPAASRATSWQPRAHRTMQSPSRSALGRRRVTLRTQPRRPGVGMPGLL